MAANDTQVGGAHYKQDTIQHWDFVEANDIPYMEAQIIKYVMRHHDKNGKQDLEKAKHFIDKLIELDYGKGLNFVALKQILGGGSLAVAPPKPSTLCHFNGCAAPRTTEGLLCNEHFEREKGYRNVKPPPATPKKRSKK
jgi:hypothetical protein